MEAADCAACAAVRPGADTTEPRIISADFGKRDCDIPSFLWRRRRNGADSAADTGSAESQYSRRNVCNQRDDEGAKSGGLPRCATHVGGEVT